MDAASTAAFALFAAVAAFTPGPNNVMLAVSGATFGFRGTIPHILGIIVGFGLLVLAGGFGLLAFLPPFQRPIRFFVSPAFSFCCIWPGGSARPAGRKTGRQAVL